MTRRLAVRAGGTVDHRGAVPRGLPTAPPVRAGPRALARRGEQAATESIEPARDRFHRLGPAPNRAIVSAVLRELTVRQVPDVEVRHLPETRGDGAGLHVLSGSSGATRNSPGG